MARKVAFDRILQCRFFANSPYRTPPCVHVSRARGTTQQLHPDRKIGVGRESVAARKDRAQPIGGTSHQFVEERFLLAVNVAEEGEIQRMVTDRQSVDAQISDGFIVEDDKAREMQRVELREWDQRVGWVDAPQERKSGG